jgi:hypothetical protein
LPANSVKLAAPSEEQLSDIPGIFGDRVKNGFEIREGMQLEFRNGFIVDIRLVPNTNESNTAVPIHHIL